MAIKTLSGYAETKPGLTPKSGVSILGGQPVSLDTTDTTGQTIMLSAGSSVVGLALESNVAPLSLNYFYDDYNRGGLITYTCGSGAEIEVYNDGRGCPFDTTVTFVIGQDVYATVDGKISNVQLFGAPRIGFVTKVPFSATDSLKIQLSI